MFRFVKIEKLMKAFISFLKVINTRKRITNRKERISKNSFLDFYLLVQTGKLIKNLLLQYLKYKTLDSIEIYTLFQN